VEHRSNAGQFSHSPDLSAERPGGATVVVEFGSPFLAVPHRRLLVELILRNNWSDVGHDHRNCDWWDDANFSDLELLDCGQEMLQFESPKTTET